MGGGQPHLSMAYHNSPVQKSKPRRQPGSQAGIRTDGQRDKRATKQADCVSACVCVCVHARLPACLLVCVSVCVPVCLRACGLPVLRGIPHAAQCTTNKTFRPSLHQPEVRARPIGRKQKRGPAAEGGGGAELHCALATLSDGSDPRVGVVQNRTEISTLQVGGSWVTYSWAG